MAQLGKVSTSKNKANYTNAIIGVALVLFLFGIVGWFFLNLRKTGDYFKESIQVHTYLNPDAKKIKIDSLTQYLTTIHYVNRVEYVSKEKAIEMGIKPLATIIGYADAEQAPEWFTTTPYFPRADFGVSVPYRNSC